MRRPRFDEYGLGPAYIAIGIGVALIAAPRTLAWLINLADAHHCAFPNDTHLEGS